MADVMGDTACIGLIIYGGNREELQAKLRARDDRITEFEAAISGAHRHLTNLQPAIDQFVSAKERVFIDNHVDAALKALGGVNGGVQNQPLPIR